MTIGSSILLIAAGAILYFAVNADVEGVELETVGLILLIIGILALALSLFLTMRRRPGAVEHERVVERDPHARETAVQREPRDRP